MIKGFHDKHTEAFHRGEYVRKFSGIKQPAERKLDQLDAATALGDLALPANNLEKLKGDRKGQWSIRINMQWRICFVWDDGMTGPERVEIVDYH